MMIPGQASHALNVELLGRYSNRTDWAELVGSLGRKCRRAVPEAPLSRGIVRRLSDEQVAELIDRYLDGATMNALAELFEVHRTTVSLHLKRQGLRFRWRP
jgi:hypothetical protein